MLSRWSNDQTTTVFMATGREWVGEREALELWAPDGSHAFIIEHGAVLTPTGVIGLYALDLLSRKAELRVMLGANRGHGVGSWAVKELLRYAFIKLGLERVYLGTAAANTSAVWCFKTAGFQLEGCLRRDLLRDNMWYDNLRFGILRSEWEARLKWETARAAPA